MNLLRIYGIIASIFSVAFSLTIVLEINQFVELPVTIIIGVFVAFVMIVNETIKVKQLHAKFYDKKKTSTLIIFTVSLSILMSSIGIYFFTTESQSKEISASNNLAERKLEITNKYALKRDSLINDQISNPEYTRLQENLNYWKNRICHTELERSQARNNAYEIEMKLQSLHADFKRSKDDKLINLNKLEDEELNLISIYNNNIIIQNNYNFWLFIIIFALVIVTEVMIIYIQYLISKIYTSDQKIHLKIFQTLLMKETRAITLNDIKFHPFNPFKDDPSNKMSWNYTKDFYFLLGNLGLIDHDGNLSPKDNALQILQNYYLVQNKTI